MNPRSIHIFGGGTISHISNHLALTAIAKGTTAKMIEGLVFERWHKGGVRPDTRLHLTGMCPNGDPHLNTIDELELRLQNVISDPTTRVVFFTPAVVDFEYNDLTAGQFDPKYKHRLSSSQGHTDIGVKPTRKLVSQIRKHRKDIFLVACKTTCYPQLSDITRRYMYLEGLKLCKASSCNLVLVNNVHPDARWNMIITPEEAAYHETSHRNQVLTQLVDMAFYRSQLTFTQSTVIAGEPISWEDPIVPDTLRRVVNHCIERGAYKQFNGATVGHFAAKIGDTEFLTSIRKTNFNKIGENGLVRIKTDGPDTVLAYGAKPSVGGQSQRQVFNDHEGYDCIAHFHSPLKDGHRDEMRIVSQREVECGSHQCGAQTSKGLREYPQYGGLKCVMLNNHGPNILFKSTMDPKIVTDFIDHNFDLAAKTGGYQLP